MHLYQAFANMEPIIGKMVQGGGNDLECMYFSEDDTL